MDPALRLASGADAAGIAALSRDLIERGLGWRWTPARVLRSIGDAETNVVVADAGATAETDAARAGDGRPRLAGFGIMSYGPDEAHLLLLAVHPAHGRRGLGSTLVGWLEKTALTAGVRRVSLEARVGNAAARAFYRRLGYEEVERVSGYYRGVESGVRLAKDL